jgi:xanthine dehydrogenase YagT iron-sulfur-binding subunit
MATDKTDDNGLTRRGMLRGASGVAAAQFLPLTPARAEAPATPANNAGAQVALTINGRSQFLTIDPRMTLLDLVRERLNLTGAKKGCDHGQCGACTVHIDGKAALSCLTLAVAAEGHNVTTIEGLAKGDALHPMQSAFIEHDAFQCGYCTPGQIMAAVACVHEGKAGSDDTIREYMSGNLCRCGAYPKIVAAIKDAATKTERG